MLLKSSKFRFDFRHYIIFPGKFLTLPTLTVLRAQTFTFSLVFFLHPFCQDLFWVIKFFKFASQFLTIVTISICFLFPRFQILFQHFGHLFSQGVASKYWSEATETTMRGVACSWPPLQDAKEVNQRNRSDRRSGSPGQFLGIPTGPRAMRRDKNEKCGNDSYIILVGGLVAIFYFPIYWE